MPRVGRRHFDKYTPQNRVKHAILTKYLNAYLRALGQVADAFHYIDGFAGPGVYAVAHPGSPLVALELLSKQSRPATASFVESDSACFDDLERAVAETDVASLFEAPLVLPGEFADHLDTILDRPIYHTFRGVATFAFVDPCGVNGLRVADLSKILAKPFGECLVFWNFDGLKRWLGGVAAGTHARSKLDEFYGSSEAAEDALSSFTSRTGSIDKERRLRDGYLRAVRERSRAKYILPFRFRANDSKRTKHYLIHLARHARAFVIMKDIMKRETSATDDVGHFDFAADDFGAQGDMFRPNAERARADVLQTLAAGPRRVALFTKEWVERPNDFLVEKEYRQLLIALEREGAVDVLNEAGEPKPAAKRRSRKGEATLGDDYFVRLRVLRE